MTTSFSTLVLRTFVSEQALRLKKLARYLWQPQLLHLRRHAGGLHTYLKLRQPWLQAYGFNTIIDIGANVGQFALAARFAFPHARIYSFEPLPDCYETLNRNFQGKPDFQAFNIALGRESGSLEFEHNQFTAASSFRPMAAAHKREFPCTVQTTPLTVKVRRLDDIAESLHIKGPVLIKIDVQGYEDEVLAGGRSTLSRAQVVLIEVSFEILYEGQPLFDDIYHKFASWGFDYKGSLEQIYSPGDGRPLQADSVFVRHT